MGDARLSDTKIYAVLPQRPVSLRVTVGDAQVGGTAVTLNGAPIPVNQNGETPIGSPGQNLRGSVLQVVTTVRDINEQSDRTSVTHVLTGGAAPMTFAFAISVTANHGIARYLITYVLV